MKRLIGMMWAMFLYFCAATLISAAALGMVFAGKWGVTGDRASKALAVMRGEELEEKTSEKPKKAPPAEQASYDQLLELRDLKFRDWDLKRQELRNGLAQVRSEDSKLADEKKKFKQVRESFDAQLAAIRADATSTGMDEVRATLETLKPKQAKEQFSLMLEDKRINDVATLLTAMPDGKRAKILAEFKTPDDAVRVSEVLKLIREGGPVKTAADAATKKLANPKQK